jgi:hypothetical protein
MTEPIEDTAAPCAEHQSCIRGFKRRAAGELMPLAGWWHLEWDDTGQRWHLTDPSGGTRDVDVPDQDRGFPPAALIGAVPGLLFQPIVSAILELALFPPRRAT